MPKLIINGTNDFYWATDALNLYWDGIPSDKWVMYVPNAGHNLRRQDRPRAEQFNHLVDGLAAFSRHQISGVPIPRLRWSHQTENGKLRLTIAATPMPVNARLWIARSATADLRTSVWDPHEASLSGDKIVGEVTPPETGHLAFFGELDYRIDGLHYHLSTQVRMTN
jgi:PhoPQ-activated pathogenicity-related protein